MTWLAQPTAVLSACPFSALWFDVLSFDRLLVWQYGDKAPLHRSDDADSYTKVRVLRVGANRLVLLGHGDCVNRVFQTNRELRVSVCRRIVFTALPFTLKSLCACVVFRL